MSKTDGGVECSSVCQSSTDRSVNSKKAESSAASPSKVVDVNDVDISVHRDDSSSSRVSSSSSSSAKSGDVSSSECSSSSFTSGLVESVSSSSCSSSDVVCENSEGNNSSSDESTRLDDVRRFVGPLSKEQLMNILASAAYVHSDVLRACTSAVESSPASRRLMIRNVSFSSRDEAFLGFFRGFGDVDDAVIVRERDGRSRGYGFVTFKTLEGCKKCLGGTPLTLDGKELSVKLAADPFTDKEQQRKLFVRNLSDVTEADSLRTVFSRYGNLEECVVVKDGKGKSKGYAFLTFSKPSEAFQAVQQSERVIDGRVVFINFAAPFNSKSLHGKNASNAGRIKAAERDHKARGNITHNLLSTPVPAGMSRDQYNRVLSAGAMQSGAKTPLGCYWGNIPFQHPGGGRHGMGRERGMRNMQGDRTPPNTLIMMAGAPDAATDVNVAAAAAAANCAAGFPTATTGYPYMPMIDPRLFGQSFTFNYPNTGGLQASAYDFLSQAGAGTGAGVGPGTRY